MSKTKYAARIAALTAGAACVAQKAIADIIVVDLTAAPLTTVPYQSNFGINPVANQTTQGYPNGFSEHLWFDSSLGYGSYAYPSANVRFMGTPNGGDHGDYPEFSQLSAGASIGSGSTFLYGSLVNVNSDINNGITASSFLGYAVVNQGVGGNETWYGWIEYQSIGGINTFSYPPTSDFTVLRYAFDNTGADILAGQTVAAAVPEPSTTAALFGVAALGVLGFRRLSLKRAKPAVAA